MTDRERDSIGIVISCRRKDSAVAQRLHDRLSKHFGPEVVSWDVDAVAPGGDFRPWVSEALINSDAVIVVIGRGWLDSPDDGGRRRIDDPSDRVPLEIEVALAQSRLPVIPVLVEGATMPTEDQLPSSIQGLAMRQGLRLTAARWEQDVTRLIGVLEEVVVAQEDQVESGSQSTPSRKGRRDEEQTSTSGGARESTGPAAAAAAGEEGPEGSPAAEAGGGVPADDTEMGAQVELSDGVQAILGEALLVLSRRSPPAEVLDPVDVLLGACVVAARSAGRGSAEALFRSLPEPPTRAERLREALGLVGLGPSEQTAQPIDQVPDAAWAMVVAASSCHLQTTGVGPVSTRHLLAAAVNGDLSSSVLDALGTSQPVLAVLLLGYVARRWPNEAPHAWAALLSPFAVGAAPPDSRASPEAQALDLSRDARRLSQLAASVADDGLPDGRDVDVPDVDAESVVIAALCDGTGEPTLRVTAEMLAWICAREPVLTHPPEMARRVLAATGRPGVHMTGPPDLSAPAAAALVAAAAHHAERTTGQQQVGARHLLGAAVTSIDPTSAVVRELGTVERLRASLRHAVRATSPDDSTDAWDTILFGPDQPLGGGYTRDVGWPEEGEKDDTEDRLGRQAEAKMFASLITDGALIPPLAIGLFGPWGSGKSFFMKLIHRGVAANVSDGSYAQIRFNAWHYSDANLWASLADELFEQLAAHVRGPEPDAAVAVRRDLDITTEARRAVEARQAEVGAARDRLRAELRDATTRREQARRGRSLAHTTRLAAALAADEDAQRDLEVASTVLGITEPVAAYRAIAAGAQGVTGEADSLARATRGRLWWSVLATIAALCLVAAAAALVPGAVRAWGFTAAITVAAGLAQAARVVASASKVTTAVHRFFNCASAHDERLRAEPTEEEAGLAGELRDAEAAEAAAATQLAEVDARIAALQAELAELSGERRLYRFLTDRASSPEYKGQLGVISIIRRDLDTLLRRLQSQTGLRRIVLYIDDLDRCEPAQVVAVLQAVNLLLGTSLFVVVLGVDPTWLERSLLDQYASLVAGSTPREYLEKIFQIPFVLPPMADGFSSFMRSMVGPPSVGAGSSAAPIKPVPADEPAGAAGTGQPGEPTTAVGAPPAQAPIVLEAGSAAATVGETGIEAVEQPTAPTSQELDMLAALGSLVQTPRAATRVVNLYRLVRTTRYIGRSSRFLGTDGAAPDYMVVIQLLAVATRSPDVLAELTARLRDPSAAPESWATVLSRPPVRPLPPEWDEVVAALQALAASFPLPDEPDSYRTWAPTIARFTFDLEGPPLAIDELPRTGDPPRPGLRRPGLSPPPDPPAGEAPSGPDGIASVR